MKLAIDYNQKAEAGRRFLYNMEGSPASLIELARTLTNFAEVLKSSDNFAQALLKVEEAELLLKQAMHGQPEEIAFIEMIPTVFLKANIWLLQNGHRKNYGIKSMASLRDWAKTHPDFYYSPVIIDECIKYQIP